MQSWTNLKLILTGKEQLKELYSVYMYSTAALVPSYTAYVHVLNSGTSSEFVSHFTLNCVQSNRFHSTHAQYMSDQVKEALTIEIIHFQRSASRILTIQIDRIMDKHHTEFLTRTFKVFDSLNLSEGELGRKRQDENK